VIGDNSMSSRFRTERLLALGLSSMLFVTQAALAAEPFAVASPAFKDGDVWQSKYAGSDPSRTNPPCPGQNVSPPLTWTNSLAATTSFSIIVYDPDGGNGLGVSHWVAYNISATRPRSRKAKQATRPRTGPAERTVRVAIVISARADRRVIPCITTSSRSLPPTLSPGSSGPA
jgi:phosphatidylethanolamine-binding protein (PEBP) family uncharacterized protein